MDKSEIELLFDRKNLTDLEKLLFAENHISKLKNEVKNLKIQIGKQKAHIDELEYNLKQGKTSIQQVINQGKKINKAKNERDKAMRDKADALKKSKIYLNELIRLKFIIGDKIKINI